MNFNSLIADTISRLNTGNRHRVRKLYLNYNKTILNILVVLLDLGLIRGFIIELNRKVRVDLRFRGGFHIFYKLNLVSKASRRIYWKLNKLLLEIDSSNSKIYVISTRRGLMLGSECIWYSLTGEVFFKVLL